MPKVTAEEFAEKHARRLKASLDDIRKGVERIKESPSAAAAKKLDKMRERWLRAMDEGKIKRGLESVTLDEWKANFLEKGVNRIPTGVDRAHDKVVKFAEKLLAHQAAGQAKIKAMPDVTLEDSIARATEWIRHMAKFRK